MSGSDNKRSNVREKVLDSIDLLSSNFFLRTDNEQLVQGIKRGGRGLILIDKACEELV